MRFGNGKDILDPKEANFNGKYPKKTYSLNGPYLQKTSYPTIYKPNSLGLFDMAGNVCTWCFDWYKADFYRESPKDNPVGPSAGTKRVLRGGGWGGNATMLRAAYRYSLEPENSFFMAGLRLAKNY